MGVITDGEVRQLLAQSPDWRVQAMSREIKVIKSLTGVLNASVKLADAAHDPLKLTLALSEKAVKVTEASASASGAPGLKAAAFVGTQAVKSVGLVKLAGMTPARTGASLTFAVADKVLTAASLADTRTFTQCQYAVASLAATSGLGVLSCAGSAGVACVAGAHRHRRRTLQPLRPVLRRATSALTRVVRRPRSVVGCERPPATDQGRRSMDDERPSTFLRARRENGAILRPPLFSQLFSQLSEQSLSRR